MVRLAEVRRAGQVESVHFGWAVVLDASGAILFETPDAPPIFARSAAKPFQALPLVASGAFDSLGLDDSHLALCCASHAGEPVHLAGVREILARAGLTEGDLQCGSHAPLADPQARATALANNCSGKHAGMLAACRFNGWDSATYRDRHHPLQAAIASTLAALGDSELQSGVDGCGVPAWQLPLAGLALAYARLPQDPAGQRILRAMADHPTMVSGTGRRDTRLMQVSRGRIVSKGGAEGVAAGCAPAAKIGFALKIADGNPRAVEPVLLTLLGHLGLLDSSELAELAEFVRPVVRNHSGIAVGEIVGTLEAKTLA
ncbi:MAG: asparaginase [Cyanobacteria bacterium REEB65]|nr:asparaginase [Cyanobacteria bacterium REEB65]